MIKKEISKYKMFSNNILYLIIVQTKFLRLAVNTKYYVAFEKLIDTMTVGAMLGRNSLSKRNI